MVLCTTMIIIYHPMVKTLISPWREEDS